MFGILEKKGRLTINRMQYATKSREWSQVNNYMDETELTISEAKNIDVKIENTNLGYKQVFFKLK